MIATTIFPGRYMQGCDSLERLGSEMARLGAVGFVVGDGYVLDHLLPGLDQKLAKDVKVTVERLAGECSDEEVQRLSEVARGAGAEVIAGIGGGKTMDTAKAVAHELRVPVIIAPTAASTDAPCSALSVIYTPEGEYKRYLILPKNPDVVLVDTRIITGAPVRLLVSGMGDALATWFEAQSARSTCSANMTGDHSSMTAMALARLCYDTLLDYGVLAVEACKVHAVTPALERVVEANTLLSGLGFESGGLGSAHAIHNGLTALEPTHNYYHGEKVAIGVLASLHLTDKSMELIDEVYSFCESVGLPTTFRGIGLEGVSDEDLMKVGQTACAEGETIHNEPMPVEPWTVVDALKTADQEGLRRSGAA